MNIILRSPLVQDAFDIRRIQAEGWLDNNLSTETGVTEEFLSIKLGLSLPPQKVKVNQTKKLIKKNTVGYFVAEYEGKVVGWIMGRSHDEDRQIYSFGIYVDRAFRNKGIGSRLMKSFLDIHKEKKIKIEVTSRNVKGIRFYESFGFHVAAQDKHYFDGYGQVYLPIVVMQNYE